MILALSIGALVAGAAYLLTDRTYLRMILGFLLLGHAVNLLLLAAGGVQRRAEPLQGADAVVAADPLPQAFVLTAIVIAFAITIVMVALAVTGPRDDDTHSPDGRDGRDGPEGELVLDDERVSEHRAGAERARAVREEATP